MRNYAGGDDIVWGGDPNCDHVWEGSVYHEHREEVKSGKTRTTERFYGEPSRKFNGDHQRHYSNVFCVKCDAWKGQLGLEPTPELYVEHLMMIFREVKRVLRRDGSFYLNIGDTYAGSGMGWSKNGVAYSEKLAKVGDANGFSPPRPRRVGYNSIIKPGAAITEAWPEGKPPQFDISLPAKCMVCIPEQVMFALIQAGFILRNKLIWRKPNALPSSVKDRYTTTWEYLYFFVKNDKPILWRNKETGEWRDTEPTKEEKYPWGGRYRNIYTGEMRWDKPADMTDWEHLVPVWQGFDYYFDLDSIRVSHKTQSLQRYLSALKRGQGGIGKLEEGIGAIQHREGMDGICAVPGGVKEWFDEMLPETRQPDLFGHGPNPQSFNLRIRDVKRGKGGLFIQGGKVKELKASKREIEEYMYPEKPDWRAQAARKGQLFNNPVAHQGGGNTGLKKEHWVRPSRANVPGRDELGNTIKKHHGSSHDGRAGLDRPHFKYQEGIAIQHREGMDGIVAPLDPKGKNPGDFLEITTQPFPGAHFAVYPEALCEMPIKASSRIGDLVLDPFAGSGTTGVVAKKLGRKAILIDCVESYCAMSRDRIKKVEYQPELPLQQSTTRK